jgi:hypothetical protein
MHLVQLGRNKRRAIAIVDGDRLQLLAPCTSVYELAMDSIRRNEPFSRVAQQAVSGESLDYEPIHAGQSEWRLLCPVDAEDPAYVMVSGTGLTHEVSAENRAAMHKNAGAPVTDSMRMFELGKQGGQPAENAIGVQPEWFYKGDGSILRAHLEALDVPPYARDGGEEAEIAAAYLIGDNGLPYRIGFMLGNEFSDHVTEKENFLYLAHSKLRTCSLGPEIVVGDESAFNNVTGSVAIRREAETVWQAKFYSGEKICATRWPISNTTTSSTRRTDVPATCMSTSLAQVLSASAKAFGLKMATWWRLKHPRSESRYETPSDSRAKKSSQSALPHWLEERESNSILLISDRRKKS